MVIIFRGISGSGKSTLLRNFLQGGTIPKDPVSGYLKNLESMEHKISFSADDYFTVNGSYVFDHRYLSLAHNNCLRKFSGNLLRYADSGSKHVFLVDNTNTTILEVAPYIALAEAYAHPVSVITLIGDPVMCIARNSHGVPFDSIIRQDINLRESISKWPSRFAQYQKIFPFPH